MLYFEEDLDSFFDLDDFAVNVIVVKTAVTFTALFDYNTENDFNSKTRYPKIQCRVRDIKSLKEGDLIKVRSSNEPKESPDRIFRVRDIPDFTFDDEVVDVDLRDMNTDSTRRHKYIPDVDR